MGYTHYIKNPKGFTDAQWQAFIKAAKDIISNSPVPLAGALGDENTMPIISHKEVCFNGLGDDGCETCLITKEPFGFEFCKTRQLPYDEVVVAIYKAARNANPSIELSSDGDVFDSEPEVKYTHIAEFVYNKNNAFGEISESKWRKVGMVGMIGKDDTYIAGYDIDDGEKYKQFKMANVVGGIDKIKITPI